MPYSRIFEVYSSSVTIVMARVFPSLPCSTIDATLVGNVKLMQSLM